MKKFVTHLLVVLLVFGTLTGCKGKAAKKVHANGSSSTSSVSSATTSGKSSLSSSGVSGSAAALSGAAAANNAKSSKGGASGSSKTKINTKVDISKDITGNFELPKFPNIKGTSVELFTTASKDSDSSKKWIAEMKDTYGVTLNFTTVASASFTTTLQSRLMAGTAPDVVQMVTAGMYTYPLNNYLENVTGKINLDSPMWKGVAALNRSFLFSNKQFLIMVGSYVNNFVWFNRTLMKDNGIADTPDVLYDQHKWTVDAMMKLAKQFTYTDKSTNYYGLASNYSTLGGSLMVSHNAVIDSQQSNGTFVSQMGSSKMADAMNKLYSMYNTDKVVMPNSTGDKTLDANAFYYGQAAMCLYSQSLSSQSRFAQKMKSRQISFVPFPKWDASSPDRQWGTVSTFGIGKGAKNVNGALAFISYRRFDTADITALKAYATQRKTDYYNTDKEISYLNQAGDNSVMSSWEGIPSQPQSLMTKTVAAGSAWASVLQTYEPKLEAGLKTLNDLLK